MPMPSMNASTSAVITPNIAGISMVKNGVAITPLPAGASSDLGVMSDGKVNTPVK